MLIPNTPSMNTRDATASISTYSWISIFTPINTKSTHTPNFRYLNLSDMAASRKNMARNPSIAKILEKKGIKVEN